MRYELHIDFLFPILNPWSLVKSGSELNPRGFSENQCLHHNLASHQNRLLFAFLGRFFTENRSFSVLSRLSGHFGYSTTWIVADANIETKADGFNSLPDFVKDHGFNIRKRKSICNSYLTEVSWI